MRLLFDQNLSFRLVSKLSDIFPGSSHVRLEGMSSADDAQIWDFAKQHGFAIATKDDDFYQRSLLMGAPPKVIWLHLGNCTTDLLEAQLRGWAAEIQSFERDPETSIIVIGRRPPSA